MDGGATTKKTLTLDMKNWIENLIAFIRFVVFGRLPKAINQTTNTDLPPDLVLDGNANSEQDLISDSKPTVAEEIISYMEEKGYFIDRNPGNGNVIYLSGLRDAYGLPSENKIDEWDDLRLIIKFSPGGRPMLDFWQAASTEPGTISRKSAAAKKLGGVATVVPGQYKAWKMGYHKHNVDHPALVQCANIVIWRDSNTNESFDGGDMMFEGVYGINQHSTRPGFSGPRVGAWSAGCLVGKDFGQHLDFINRLKQWDCYKENPDCVFWTTIIPGKSLWKEESPVSV